MYHTGVTNYQAALLTKGLSFHGLHHLGINARLEVKPPKGETVVGLVTVNEVLENLLAVFAVLYKKMGVMALG
jgi:hypothetical protein